MTLSITPIYAGFLALMFLFLTLKVIGVRRAEMVALGDGGKPNLIRAQRVHGNFCEYVPLLLVLMVLAELQNGPAVLIHAIGILTLFGRLLHAYGVSRENENYKIRVTAMLLTFAALLIGALSNLGMPYVLSIVGNG